MGYDTALLKAWDGLCNISNEKILSVMFLADEYTVDVAGKKVLSLSCNVPAKDYLTILILHYLTSKLKGLSKITGDWISFKQLDGGQGYYPAFKKRVISTIARKYKTNPQIILSLTERFKAKRIQLADISVVVDVFEDVPVLIEAWGEDAEFGAEVNVLFDRSISEIFCTEDTVIMSEFLAHAI